MQVRDSLGLTYDVSFEVTLFDRIRQGWFMVHVTSHPDKVGHSAEPRFCIIVPPRLDLSSAPARHGPGAAPTILSYPHNRGLPLIHTRSLMYTAKLDMHPAPNPSLQIYDALNASISVLRDVKYAPVNRRELARARTTLLTRHESDMKDNSYWLGLLTHLQVGTGHGMQLRYRWRFEGEQQPAGYTT